MVICETDSPYQSTKSNVGDKHQSINQSKIDFPAELVELLKHLPTIYMDILSLRYEVVSSYMFRSAFLPMCNNSFILFLFLTSVDL
jgi:hypothetical protein